MMKKYLRMTLNERIQHINLMINFTILVITGFALRFPEAFWASPMTDVPSGMTVRGLLHRLCGVAILTLGGYHFLYGVFTKRGRGILKDMLPRWRDARDLWETLKNNFFINRPAKELKMGRFNFREKLEYLALIWGTIVMAVTGFILWYEVEWLKYFPKWTYAVAQTVHLYEAILATLAIIVWHFYSVIFDPETYPMNWAWITGNMTEHEMKLEHGLELERIMAEERRGEGKELEAFPVDGENQADPFSAKQEEGLSIRNLVGTVRGLNETMKEWKGGTKSPE